MSTAEVTAPVPESRPQVISAHGDDRVDEWYWLRDKDDPTVIAHLEAENAYTEAMTARTEGLRQALYEEIVGRIQETDLTVPVRRADWWYYSRTVEGLQYPIHCRKPAPAGAGRQLDERPVDAESIPGDEAVILDQNVLAEGHDFLALGAFEVSPDHRLLAYSTDTTGGERYGLRFVHLGTGALLDDVVEDTYYGVAWSADSGTVFYTRPDHAMRPYQLWRHRLGTPAEDDVCVLTEEDERFFVGVDRTKDGAFVVCEIASKVTTEVRVLAAADPTGEWRVVEPRRQGVEYSLEHHRNRFLIVTNDGAVNFKLVEAPEDEPGRANWSEVVGHRPDVKLDGVDVFADFVVLFERFEAATRLRVMTGDGAFEVDVPEAVSSVWALANPEYEDHVLRFGYTSLVTPQTVFDYDMASRQRRLLKQQPVLGGYDPARFVTERLWADTEDGARVPVSVVRRRDVALDGRAPALLYGYGSYEISTDPYFSPFRLSLLERGFVFAIAHVRGGGEMGRLWYEDGKMLRKANTFSDFVAAARLLVAGGYTSPQRLAARGGSAGGLLMGAVLNAAPKLFGAVVAEVPFVDCLSTILDESLPLTVIEWEEWGNPVADAEAYRYIKSYSPYDNVADRPYPAILATAGLNDPRVGYWEPAKWVAKLRRHSTSGRPILLKTELGAGHRGPSGRYDAWRDEAFVLGFVIDALGAPSAPLAFEPVASASD